MGPVLPTHEGSYRILVLVYMAETEVHQSKDDGKIKSKINLDRHGPVPVPNNRHLPQPPWFSLQTTFKKPTH
jgi:hypothetical protein